MRSIRDEDGKGRASPQMNCTTQCPHLGHLRLQQAPGSQLFPSLTA